MKKIVSLLVALLLVCTAAYAESPDLAAMSLEELVQLHKVVDAEIDARIGCEPSAIAGGVYVAGETIKTGAYLIECAEAYAEAGMEIQMFDSETTYSYFLNGNKPYLIYSANLAAGQSATVSLKEGMVLVINGGAGLAQAVQPDWAM